MAGHSSFIVVSALMLALAGTANNADAQLIRRPPRSTAGLFGGLAPVNPQVVQQQLSLGLNLLGGYDDNVLPDGQGAPNNPLVPARTSTTGAFGSDVRYVVAKGTSSLEANGHGQVDAYGNVSVRPLVAGTGSVRGTTRLGSRFTLNGQGQTEYRPIFTFTGFQGRPETVTGSTGEPSSGLLLMRSLGSGGAGALDFRWSARNRTGVTSSYNSNHYFDEGGLDSTAADAELRHTWNFSRPMALRASVRRSHQATLDDRRSLEIPLDSVFGSLGVEYTKRLSRTRQLSITVAPGISRVRTISARDNRPLRYNAPGGTVSGRADLGRTWALAVDWQREVTVVEQLTAQSFLTNTVSFSGGGNVGRRVTITGLGAYASGSPNRGETGSYSMAHATAQGSYTLASWLQAVASYTYGRHHLRDLSVIPAGFPNRFRRNALRFGIAVSLPLYGTFPASGRTGTGRN